MAPNGHLLCNDTETEAAPTRAPDTGRIPARRGDPGCLSDALVERHRPHSKESRHGR